jgi:cephalosporin-C deacetylase
VSVPTTHPFAFDPTYGMQLEQLLTVTPPEAPPGFDDFWRKRYRRALAVDPQPVLRQSKISHPRWHVLDIVYTSTSAFQIGGWLLLPRKGQVRRGLVVGHGYGGRDQPDFDLPMEETALLFPCFRGLSLSARLPISSDPAWHVLHHIDTHLQKITTMWDIAGGAVLVREAGLEVRIGQDAALNAYWIAAGTGALLEVAERLWPAASRGS